MCLRGAFEHGCEYAPVAGRKRRIVEIPSTPFCPYKACRRMIRTDSLSDNRIRYLPKIRIVRKRKIVYNVIGNKAGHKRQKRS